MRLWLLVTGCWWAVACVDAPDLMHGSSALPDAGPGTLDAGPLKPPVAPPRTAAQSPSQAPAGAQSVAAAGSLAPPYDAGPAPAQGPTDRTPPPTPGQRLAAPARLGQLVITEIMVDPKTLSDTEGEWFELANTTDSAFDLQGCLVDDGSKEPRSIDSRLVIPPAGYITIARREQPGFTASYVASISFTNSADTIALRCADVEIDRVAYDKARGFPLTAGASLSLDHNQSSAQLNDSADAWCAASQSYGPELGTPGKPNPSCDAADDGGPGL